MASVPVARARGLVDRHERGTESLDVHQEIVDLELDVPAEEIAEDADHAEGVDAAERVVRSEGVIPLRTEVLQSFHLQGDMQVFQAFVGEFDAFPALLEKGIEEILVDDAANEGHDEPRHLSEFLPEDASDVNGKG